MKRVLAVIALLVGFASAQTTLGPTNIVLLGIGHYTAANLNSRFPAPNWTWYTAWVIDGPDCVNGGGSTATLCWSNGVTWGPLGTGNGCVAGGLNINGTPVTAPPYKVNGTPVGSGPIQLNGTTVSSGCGGSSANFASPPPLGNVTPNTVNWTTSPMGINVASYSGSDIGAQINTAISVNSCGTNNCLLELPPGVYSYSTAVTIPANTTLDCGARGGWSSLEAPSPTATTLSYTGTGDAVTLSGVQSAVRNCSLTVGTSATSGVKMTAGQTTVSHSYLVGGGTSTKLVNINCGGSGCEKPELDFDDFYNYTGDAIYCANSNDTTLTNLTGYATGSQTTSVAVTIDSQCNGLKGTRLSFGGAGLHQLVFSDTLSTGAPTWTVLETFEADCAEAGAGILFDSTVSNQNMHARLTNGWAAGSGQNCANPTGANISISPGVEIDGGWGITLDTFELRANTGDGLLINDVHSRDISITNSKIWANNYKYRTFGGDNGDYNGIRVSAISSGLVIVGNYLGNYPGTQDGHQHYGVKASATNPLNMVVTGNTFDDNTVAPYTFVNGAYAYPVIYGNATPNVGTTPMQTMLGDLAVSGLTGQKIAPHVIPTYGATSTFLMGLGINGYFDGTNWHFPSDTTNNGGALLLGTEQGAGALYAVPTNGTPASDQTVTTTNLNANNQALSWGTTGIVNIPKFGTLTSSSSNPATLCTICFASANVLSWRNNANSGNLNLGINGSDQLTFNGTVFITPLVGVTGSIGGSALTSGSCSTGTVSITGAIVGHPVSVSASDGTLPNGLIVLSASVTSSNTVTVQVCATGNVTPAAKAYNVATQ